MPRSDAPPAGGTGAANAPIMQFRVAKARRTHSRKRAHRGARRVNAARAHRRGRRRASRDNTSIPAQLRPLPAWTRSVSPVPTVVWNFGLNYGPTGFVWTINGKTMDPNRVDAQVPLGSIQTWEFTNSSNITHYVHVHDVQFLELSRDGHAPDPWEAGLKDTFRVDPGESVIVAAKFPDYTGRYMIHCHMLDHEDHGMMTQFEVVGPGGLGVPPDTGSRPPTKSSGALGLPSNKHCKSRQRFVFQIQPPPGMHLKSARVYVNGRPVARLGRGQLKHNLALTNLPSNRFTIRISARTTDGKSITAARAYRACPTHGGSRPRAVAADPQQALQFECHLSVLGSA